MFCVSFKYNSGVTVAMVQFVELPRLVNKSDKKSSVHFWFVTIGLIALERFLFWKFTMYFLYFLFIAWPFDFKQIVSDFRQYWPLAAKKGRVPHPSSSGNINEIVKMHCKRTNQKKLHCHWTKNAQCVFVLCLLTSQTKTCHQISRAMCRYIHSSALQK